MSGRLLRSSGTAIDTRVNAASVPMFTISSSLPIGVTPATIATTTPIAIVRRYGVPNFGCVLPSCRGTRWSRLIANTTRAAPIISVSTTVVRPATAPAEINVAKPARPTERNASASAASPLMSVYLTMPVMTMQTST